MIESADELQVAAVRMRVLALEDVMTAKLLALGDHDLDYFTLLESLCVIGEHDAPPCRDEVRVRPFEASVGPPTFGPARDATR